MPGPDVRSLTPSDCVAALRSYPRRFRAALTDVGDDATPDDLAHRVGPGGRSALDEADHVARSVALLGQSMRSVLVEDHPTLLPAVLDDGARAWEQPGATTVEAVLDFVSVECEGLAEAVGHVSTDEWARTAVVAGSGQEVTALDVLREAVRTGAVGLTAAEAAMRAARS